MVELNLRNASDVRKTGRVIHAIYDYVCVGHPYEFVRMSPINVDTMRFYVYFADEVDARSAYDHRGDISNKLGLENTSDWMSVPRNEGCSHRLCSYDADPLRHCMKCGKIM